MTEKKFKYIHSVVFAAGALTVLALFFLCFQFVCIPSESMVPTYDVDDVLIVRKTQDVKRDKVVLFYHDTEEGQSIFIKRCVGLPGDTIAVHDGKLIRNGEVLDEPYLNEPYIYEEFEEITVPEGMIFVMGDNRNNSYDSRWFGPVDIDDVLGRPLLTFF